MSQDSAEKRLRDILENIRNRYLERMSSEAEHARTTFDRILDEFKTELDVLIKSTEDLPDGMALLCDPTIIIRGKTIPEGFDPDQELYGCEIRLNSYRMGFRTDGEGLTLNQFAGGRAYLVLVPPRKEEDHGEK